MTTAQKILIIQLLQGHSLAPAPSRSSKKCYRLMDAKRNPIAVVSETSIDSINRQVRKKIWKKDKRGCITLNLSKVRQLHGRTTIKQLYKKGANIVDGLQVVKAGNNRKKLIKSDQNEKNLSLF